MTGLLHRLAARAAGTAVAVRSDARLPYNGPALGWTDATETEIAVPARPEPPHAPVAVPPLLDVRENAWPPATMEAAAESSPAVNAERVQDATASSAKPPALPVLERLVFTRTEVSTGRDPATSAQARGERPDARPSSAIPAAPDHEPNAVPMQSRPRVARDPATSAQAQGEWPDPRPSGTIPAGPDREPNAVHVQSRARVDPAPLLPQAAPRTIPSAARVSPVTSAPGAARAQALTNDAANEGTEVHIHIGRIEVTAVHAAPPPPRKAARHARPDVTRRLPRPAESGMSAGAS